MTRIWREDTLHEWETVVERSELTLAGISSRFEMAYSNLVNWFHHRKVPSKKSEAKMESIIMKLRETRRIPFHPSFGCATTEQIAKLEGAISEYERKKILEQVGKQTKLCGKID